MSQPSRLGLILALLATSFLITACGGGGGDESASASTSPGTGTSGGGATGGGSTGGGSTGGGSTGGGTVTGSATLTWNPPQFYTDGTPLTIGSYKIYWSQSQGAFPNVVTVTNPGLSSYTVDQLGAGTWFFVVTAVDSGGVESTFSNVASKTI